LVRRGIQILKPLANSIGRKEHSGHHA
jgi:hypothetical protein